MCSIPLVYLFFGGINHVIELLLTKGIKHKHHYIHRLIDR